jgi:hypothetical protein
MAEMNAGGYDLLGHIISDATDRPVLIVRSPYAAARVPWMGINQRKNSLEEIVR